MATSSITKNFIVSGEEQVEMFANAIEESYQESLHRVPTPDMRITHLRGSEEVKKLWQKGRKQMLNDVTVFNIHEYLSAKDDKELGEEELLGLLSEFSCSRNMDVERFLKEQSVEFTKKKSVCNLSCICK